MLIVSTAGLLAAYTPVFAFWWRKWFEPNSYSSHGPFVVAASIALVVIGRRKIATLPLRPALIGFALMVPAVGIGLLARMTAATSLMGLALPVYILGAIIAVLGLPTARMIKFPVLFLFFAGAMPESITEALSFRLQMVSMGLSVRMLDLIGFDAVASGSRIDMSHTWVQVAEGCSGFRLTVSLLALAVFLAYFRRISVRRKALIVAVVLPLGVALNVFRITAISGVCELMRTQVGDSVHDLTGWLVMFMAVGMLFMMSKPSEPRFEPESTVIYEKPAVLVPAAANQPDIEGDSTMEQDGASVLDGARDQLPPLRSEEQARDAFERTMQAQKQLENAAMEVKEMERALANAHNAVAEARQSFTDARTVLMEHLGMRDAESYTQEPQDKTNWE